MKNNKQDILKIVGKLKCAGKNGGKMICSNSLCKSSGIICFEKNCKCQIQHDKCHFLVAQKLIEKVVTNQNKLTQDTLKSFQLIQDCVNEVINSFSLLKRQIQKKKCDFALGKAEIQLFSYLNKLQFEKINGSLISRIDEQYKASQVKNWTTSVECAAIIAQQGRKIKQICCNLREIIQPNIKIRNRDKSKITTQFDMLQKWINPTLTKPVKHFRLLYRASQSDFLTSEFHKKCDGKYNTLLLVKNNYGKIIGGFSVYPWNQTNFAYFNDLTNKSFLFSLSTKQKMTQLATKKETIFCSPSYGPTFGEGHDLFICNKANTINESCGNLGCTFNNGRYIFASQKTNAAWVGKTNGTKFLTLQWEVYQVIY